MFQKEMHVCNRFPFCNEYPFWTTSSEAVLSLLLFINIYIFNKQHYFITYCKQKSSKIKGLQQKTLVKYTPFLSKTTLFLVKYTPILVKTTPFCRPQKRVNFGQIHTFFVQNHTFFGQIHTFARFKFGFVGAIFALKFHPEYNGTRIHNV